ncbi:DUF6504 family protein [Enemella sp. A6]|uniref:DUF6504 family protein n=1 Tax=Enemella sp. A6 TaxID=3440152 RepID=UPI003EBF477C
MRRYNEQIQVDARRVMIPPTAAVGAAVLTGPPVRFRWRGQLWQVDEIHEHWVSTAEWWDSPAARALRGEETADDLGAPDPDLYDSRETWRVRAIGEHRRGLSCDLVHAGGRWFLDTLAD